MPDEEPIQENATDANGINLIPPTINDDIFQNFNPIYLEFYQNALKNVSKKLNEYYIPPIQEDEKMINLLDKYGYNNFINKYNKIINIRYYYDGSSNKFTGILFPYSKNKLAQSLLIIDINNFKYKLVDNNAIYSINYSIQSIDKIKQLAFVKIKSYKESSRLFGYGKIKKEMFEKSQDIIKDNGFGVQKTIKGELFIIDSILQEFTCKKDKSIRDIFQIKYNGKNLKFAATDLELIYPEIDQIIKGFNNKKDRTIRKNSNVLIKTKNKNKITGVVVERLEQIGYMKFSKVKIGDKIRIFNNKKLKVI